MGDDKFKQEILQRLSVIETNMSLVVSERPNVQEDLKALEKEVGGLRQVFVSTQTKVNDLNKRLNTMITTFVTISTFIIGIIMTMR